jgi:hypothetical protein
MVHNRIIEPTVTTLRNRVTITRHLQLLPPLLHTLFAKFFAMSPLLHIFNYRGPARPSSTHGSKALVVLARRTSRQSCIIIRERSSQTELRTLLWPAGRLLVYELGGHIASYIFVSHDIYSCGRAPGSLGIRSAPPLSGASGLDLLVSSDAGSLAFLPIFRR